MSWWWRFVSMSMFGQFHGSSMWTKFDYVRLSIVFYWFFFVFTSVEKSCSTPQCFNGGVCVNTIDSFKCICPIDYEGQRCDLSNDKFSIQSKRNKILFFRMERLCKSFVSTWFDVCRWCCIVFMSMFERFYGQILWNK